jgi:hypothetical protein
MSHNPYTPPAAIVADEVVPPRPMPPAVRNALILMVASLVFHFVVEAVAPASTDKRHAELRAVATVVSAVIGILATAWLAWKIGVGRNWARIVLLVLTLISVPSAIYEIVQVAAAWQVGAGLKLIELGMDVTVVGLLFIPGRAYFRKPA